METTMFEQATKNKLRFESPKGALSVEDVWDLPLTGRGFSLDNLAKNLNRQIKDAEEESFVVEQSKTNRALTLRFEIVKHIIGVRLAEKQAAEERQKKVAERARILEIIDKKENENLEGKSLDELKAML